MSTIQVFNCIDGKYTFNFDEFEDALKNSMDSLVAFYSIAGPFRTGKSFMLGFFHRYLKSKGYGDWVKHDLPETFTYRGGCDRETVGIWMWSEPFIQVVNGKRVHIFLLDTQGCFDSQTNMKDNAVIFALSTMMSSVMVFNISRQLSEDILKFFEYFAGYTKLAADTENRDEPFQRILFLIRDWQFPDYALGYYDDETDINGKNYKRDKFNVNENMADDVKYVHGSIMSMYKKVAIYLMPHPGKDLARDSMFNEKVDEEFLQHLRLLVAKVLNSRNIINKKINGVDVNGRTLISFVREWVKIYEYNESPEMLVPRTAEHQIEMAKTASFNHYSRLMNVIINESNGMSEMDFDIIDRKIFNQCLDLYRNISGTSDRIIIERYVEVVMEGLASLRSTCQRLNREKYRKTLRTREEELRAQQQSYSNKVTWDNKLDTPKEVIYATVQKTTVISDKKPTPPPRCLVPEIWYQINQAQNEFVNEYIRRDRAILVKLKEVQGLSVILEVNKPSSPSGNRCSIS